MNVNNVSLECVAVRAEQYPQTGLPEVAFAGKSNVGKSSLINTMINRKALARTSQTPGKTRTINFYNIEDAMYFVDLPGYGYAKAPKNEIDKWGEMIEKYLLDRKQLCGIIMLVDIRHRPTDNDILMYRWLRHYGYKIIIGATKLDKINRSQISKQISLIRGTFELLTEEVLVPFSSETKAGKEELWDAIGKITVNYEHVNEED